MKKLFPIAIVAVVAMMFTSCKKDYTCVCTETFGGTSTDVSFTIKDTKSGAKSKCNTQVTASSLGTGYTVSCAIK